MKKILAIIALFGTLTFTNVNAQKVAKAAKDTTGMAAKKAAKAAKKAEKKAAKAAAAAATTQAQAAPAKTVAPVATKAATVTKKTTTAAKTVTQAANTSSDKAVGTDAKGRTIYEGPRGGHYVLSASGKKEYVKKTN